jgi:exonuclease III
VYLNIQSLRKKLDQLESLVQSYKCQVHIVVVTEIWLNKDRNKFYNIPGYKAFFSNRQDAYGGAAIFVCNAMSSSIIYEEEYQSSSFLVVKLLKQNIHIVACYKSHSIKIANFLNIFEYILTNHRRSVILGDFNIDLLKTSANDVGKYLNCCHLNSYLILNKICANFDTRITDSTRTVIDHALTDLTNLKYSLHILNTALSDHQLLFLSVNTTPILEQPNLVKTVLNYDSLSTDPFWNRAANLSTFDELVHNMNTLIVEHTETIPIKNKQNNKPWFTDEISQAIKLRDAFDGFKAKYPGNTQIAEQYEEYVKKAKILVQEAKFKYYENEIVKNQGNSKHLWDLYKTVMFNQSPNTQANEVKDLEFNGVNVSDSKAVADEFNNYFISVTDNLNISSAPIDHDYIKRFERNIINRLELGLTTREEINNIINNLKPLPAATGYDKISAKLVKKFSDILSPIL